MISLAALLFATVTTISSPNLPDPDCTIESNPAPVIFIESGGSLTRIPSQHPENFCVTLDIDGTGSEHFAIPGRPVFDREGKVHWTPEQIAALASRPLILESLAEVLELTSGPSSPNPLKPECGQCKNGGQCWISEPPGQRGWNCCSSVTINCLKCRVCPKPKRGELAPVEEFGVGE